MIIITGVISGVAIAAGGWLFHRVVKQQAKLHERLDALEAKAPKK